jgi:DMSO/TMAO reductase YedYZ molybdopterin-dependent catalytic subunit
MIPFAFVPAAGYGNRRVFLKLLSAVAAAVSLPKAALAAFLSSFQTRTVEYDDFSFDPAKGLVTVKGETPAPYRLVVNGLVEKPVSFSYKELRGLAQVEQVSDFHCVEGWSVQDARWGGFRFSEILKRVRLRPGARYVVFHSMGTTAYEGGLIGNYRESFPLAELLDPAREILLALDLEGRPLSHERGAPLRLIAPYDMAYKGAKFITRIELTDELTPGWWTLANPIYPIVARVPTSRLRKKK